MAEFDEFGSDYRQRLERSVGPLGSVDSALTSKLRVLQRLAGDINGLERLPILDFGCGAGLLTGLLKQLSPIALGADVSLVSLKHAEPRTGNLVQFDGLRLPLRDNAIAMVVASCVFHHILPEERPSIVGEISRVLMPRGRLVIIEHNPFNPVTRWVVNRCEFDEDAQLLSLAETRRLLSAGGLQADRDGYFYAVPPVRPLLANIDHGLRRLPLGAQYFCAFAKPPPGASAHPAREHH
ncbi:MAG: class I SAM-dependent methyltransferase [Xanthomonadales bacterium]|nr:class I SAM-dependent methyltransferase [Xanthomonadales bacterium]NNL94225.1 class I SAM-dependent methyltransferase [Xanthomonadales bacterium]